MREIGYLWSVKSLQEITINYQLLQRKTRIYTIGLYDTDGSIWFNKDGIYLTQSNREKREQVQLLWRKFWYYRNRSRN